MGATAPSHHHKENSAWRPLFSEKCAPHHNPKALFLTHKDKVQVRSMEWEKFLCVSSKFDCFLTNGYCVFDCFSTKNSRDHALRLSLCPERALFKGFI